MSFKITLSGLALAILVAVLAALHGCTPHQVYRVPNHSIVTSIGELSGSQETQDQVASHCVESHDDFSLSFVEFDDQGDFWSRDQVTALNNMLDEESSREDTDGLIIVTFVHGWNHNASVCDENVSCFREVLSSIANVEKMRAIRSFNDGGSGFPRRVVGVYVGWRGLSLTTPVLKQTGFFARKAAAHRVGGGEVIELIGLLESYRNTMNAGDGVENLSRLITVGHSFGAAVTYSAVSKVLHERLASTSLSADPTELIKGFGDLVVLVNPAFEASLYTGIHNIASDKVSFPQAQKPVFAVVSSETDSATGFFFPIGRFFSTVFEKTSSEEQKKSTRTTLGNYQPYRTHNANVVAAGTRALPLNDIIEVTDDISRGKSDCRCSYINVDPLSIEDSRSLANLDQGEFYSVEDHRARYGSVELSFTGNGGQPDNPFYIIGATDEIVTEHNGIYNKIFLDFLRIFIYASDQ